MHNTSAHRNIKRNGVLKKFVLEVHPIIEHFIAKLKVKETLGTFLPSDKRMKVEDEQVLSLLVHNILTTPHPLYEMSDWLKVLDVERIGCSVKEAAVIQDDRVGRALMNFYSCRHKEAFFRLALRAINVGYMSLVFKFQHIRNNSLRIRSRYQKTRSPHF